MSKQKIKIVILPLSTLLFDDYLYYGSSNKITLDLFSLEEKLSPLHNAFNITEINLHGPLYNLSDFYFESIYNILKYYTKKVSVTTNLLKYTKGMVNCPDIINVMYNFNDLQNESIILKNISAISNEKVVNLKSVDIYLTTKHKMLIEKLNNSNIKSFEIIPYHQYINGNIQFVNYSLYENLVSNLISYKKDMKFAFQNKLQIDGIFNPNNYTIDTVFILPNLKYALIDFDNNKWYFNELNTIDDIAKAIDDFENKKLKYCSSCKVKNLCMANYFFNPNYIKESCSGGINLIKK